LEGAADTFTDSPASDRLQKAVAHWRLPVESLESAQKDEREVIGWLFTYIRLNVKRGRVYDLGQVLQTGAADCLGYAKLFTTLGRDYGLDAGVVEIIIDNRGRSVPHTCSLVKLADGAKQFVDFWYGSRDIRHKRLGLQVKREGAWTVEDIDLKAIKKAEDISYLPDGLVDGITLYIEGNRSLKKGDYRRAILQYNEAAGLYPQNARTYYNRATAHEKLGQAEMAQADYALALKDKAAQVRTLAVQPDDVVDLIKLDENYIPEKDQEIYLLHRGFITGLRVSSAGIAGLLAIPKEEVDSILRFIRGILKS
jgi:tetratricopeptide (TPR) repeat protein